MSVNDKSATRRIWSGGQVDTGARFRFHVQNEIVTEIGSEDQRRALSGNNHRGLAGTENLGRIHRAQWRRWRWMHGRKTDHQHRLRIAERWRIVQPEIKFILLRKRQRWNVLVLCGVRGRKNAGNINHRSDIGTVVSVT